MDIENRLKEIREEALKQIQSSEKLEKLNDVRVGVLGKKGELTALLKSMKDVAPEERPVFGQKVNETRQAIEQVLEETKKKLENAATRSKIKIRSYRCYTSSKES